MPAEWIAPVWGIVGALGAVLVQGLLARLGGDRARKRELLLQAYQAFIDSTASLSVVGGGPEAIRGLIAAKQRILYFAPADVVHALAAFCRTSQVLANSDAVAAFAELLKAMRNSLGLPRVSDGDALRILVDVDTLSDYPQSGT